MPVGLSRVVALPRAPTDREWEQLIAEFRSTFGTQGHASTLRAGSVNGPRATCTSRVEPTAQGHQLRLSTLKDDGLALNGLALVMTGMSVLFGAVIAAAGKPGKALIILGLFGGIALASFGANLVRLPRWARERERQMEATAEQAVELLSKP